MSGYLLRVIAAAVVVATGLYLIVANAQQGSGLGVAVAALQLVAGSLLLVQALRQRRRPDDATD